MATALPYPLLADAVLLLHFGIVVFVIGGLLLVVAGNLLRWSWVNGLWFRLAHAGAIGFVVAQAWLGQVCPLTALESWLRVQAGSAPYRQSFIEHWVQRILFHQAPPWIFVVAYTAFGLMVLAAWWYFPPQRGKRSEHDSGKNPAHDSAPRGEHGPSRSYRSSGLRADVRSTRPR